MSIVFKYNEIEYCADKIIWDRDSCFLDFNSYWSRLIGSIAQKIAEKTTDNWNLFNRVRTQSIILLGINLDTGAAEYPSPVNIMPVNVFPSLLASGLKQIIREKKYDELYELISNIVYESAKECLVHLKNSILKNETDIVKKINKNAKQILITNDLSESSNIFLKESQLTNAFEKSVAEINKEQLFSFLNNDSLLVTKNPYLKKYYEKKNIKNILLIKDTNEIQITSAVSSRSITVKIDGASKGNPGPAGIGVAVYKNGENELIHEISEFIGTKTNNHAEYTALIRALEICLANDYRSIEIFSDSELVVNQINKIYKIKDADIKDLFDKASLLIKEFNSFKIAHIPREENLRADKLANTALKNLL